MEGVRFNIHTMLTESVYTYVLILHAEAKIIITPTNIPTIKTAKALFYLH